METGKTIKSEYYASKLFCGKLESSAGILPKRYYHISGGDVNKMVCGSGNRMLPAIILLWKILQSRTFLNKRLTNY
jgi:hypothetical protein